MKKKYLVLKWEDIHKHLSTDKQAALFDFVEDIEQGREEEDKVAANEYWVVNKDEPYAGHVEQLITNVEQPALVSLAKIRENSLKHIALKVTE